MGTPTRALSSHRPPNRSCARLAHFGSLVVAFPLLLFVTRQQWFWFDEWDFLTRGFAGRPIGLLVPHNEHWSTIPILIYRALFSVFGLRSYQPYIGVLLIAHIAVAHLLWRLMLRSEVEQWVATTASALFLVLGAAYENIVWAFQIGFVGSFAFGLGAVLVVDGQRGGAWRWTVLTWVLLVAALMCAPAPRGQWQRRACRTRASCHMTGCVSSRRRRWSRWRPESPKSRGRRGRTAKGYGPPSWMSTRFQRNPSRLL